MGGKIDRRLDELGIVLPLPRDPVANFVSFVVVDRLVFLSGQLPRVDGNLAYKGKLGRDVSVDDGKAAARVCALHLLAHLKVACGGNLDRVARCVRLTGYVNSDPEFADQPQVINGASDVMVAVFGEKGRHARTAVSAGALPSKAAVEVEAVFEQADGSVQSDTE